MWHHLKAMFKPCQTPCHGFYRGPNIHHAKLCLRVKHGVEQRTDPKNYGINFGGKKGISIIQYQSEEKVLVLEQIICQWNRNILEKTLISVPCSLFRGMFDTGFSLIF